MSDTPASAEPSVRRRPRLAVFGIILLTLAVIAGMFAFWIRSRSAEAWANFEKKQGEALARLKALDGRRAPLVGPATPGNGWDAYKPALEAVSTDQKALPQADKDAIADGLKESPKPETKGLVAKILADRQVLLDPLRKAARCERAMFPVEWSKGAAADVPRLLAAQHAGNLFALSARSRREAGDIPGAIDELAAGSQFGLDMARPPVLISAMIAVAIVRIQLDEFRLVVTDARTSPADLERLVKLATDAEAQMPGPTAMIETDYALSNETFRQLGNGTPVEDIGVSPVLGSWRYGFSVRLMIADLLAMQERLVEATRKAESQDVLGTFTVAQERAKSMESSNNPFFMLATPDLGGVARAVREFRARLGLVRAAALVRLGRPTSGADWPVDPFNLKPIGCKVDGATTKLWSVGRDGVENPAGSWSTKKEDEDIVLELKK